MTQFQAPRCAALLVLHLALMTAARGSQPHASPRGWQAAKQAEQRARPAAADGWTPPLLNPPDALPDGGGFCQQACGWDQLPDLRLQVPSTFTLAAGAATTFLLGMAVGAALLSWLQQRHGGRQSVRRRQLIEEEVASCAASVTAAGSQQRVLVGRLQPAGAEHAEPAGGAGAAAHGKQQQSAAEAALAEGAGESGAAAGQQEAASEATAVAAAVQELVLQSAGSRDEEARGPETAASSRAASSAALVSEQAQQQPSASQQRQQERPQPNQQQQEDGEAQAEHLPLAAAAGDTSSSGGPLRLLRQDESADIQAAATLVLTICRSMAVEPAELSRGERLQLILNVLQAWQAQQARRHAEEMSRLGSEANLLRSQQRDIAAHQAARQAAKDAYCLSLERTAGFRRLCSDTLTLGLIVMVAAGAYQLQSRGLLSSVTATCGSLSTVLSGRGWGLLAAWRAGEALVCYVLGIGDALLGLAALLAAPWLVYRSGLLSDYHTMPVSKLFVGLGLLCGLAGYLAVGKLGGSRGTWLAAWEAWVALHIAFSAAAHRMHRISLRAAQQRPGGASSATAASISMYEEGSGWLPLLMWALLGVALPLAAGILPFRL